MSEAARRINQALYAYRAALDTPQQGVAYAEMERAIRSVPITSVVEPTEQVDPPEDPDSPIEARYLRAIEPMLATLGWPIRAQVRFNQYTADFVIDAPSFSVVIECDGHTYHDDTHEQRDRDRRRDRWFLREGLPTIRFSSTEIWHNAEACASETIRTISCFRRAERVA